MFSRINVLSRATVAPSLALSLVLLEFGCSAAGGPPSEGVETWVAEESQPRVGSLDGPESLSRISDLRIGPDGNLYAVLSQAHEVRVFSPEGRRLRSIGRAGNGPGEFQGPGVIGFFSDTLWVQDNGQRRSSLFQLDGSLVRDGRWPEPPTEPGRTGATHIGHLANGNSVFAARADFRSELEGTDYPFPLWVVGPEEVGTDTLATTNQAHVSAIVIRSTGPDIDDIQSIAVFREPFSDASLVDVDDRGQRVVVVDRSIDPTGAADGYRWLEVSLSGDTLRSAARATEPIPIPPAQVDSLVEALSGPTASTDELRETLFLPESYPAVSAVVLGQDETVWIGREVLPGRAVMWDVFDGEGRLAAEVELPARFRVHHAERNRVIGVLLDDLDVPYIVQFDIGRAREDG